jgi:hypothetical protein
VAKVVVNASSGNLVSHASNGAVTVITTNAANPDGSPVKDTRK